ncbi:MAG: hypothetical protein U0945_02815 [Flavobacterium sp.]|nr:hypothetical protein [Candidatus Chromulinivorax sp.]MDZ4329497.1 hypothetical protein [Flavobacterium sp.]
MKKQISLSLLLLLTTTSIVQLHGIATGPTGRTSGRTTSTASASASNKSGIIRLTAENVHGRMTPKGISKAIDNLIGPKESRKEIRDIGLNKSKQEISNASPSQTNRARPAVHEVRLGEMGGKETFAAQIAAKNNAKKPAAELSLLEMSTTAASRTTNKPILSEITNFNKENLTAKRTPLEKSGIEISNVTLSNVAPNLGLTGQLQPTSIKTNLTSFKENADGSINTTNFTNGKVTGIGNTPAPVTPKTMSQRAYSAASSVKNSAINFSKPNLGLTGKLQRPKNEIKTESRVLDNGMMITNVLTNSKVTGVTNAFALPKGQSMFQRGYKAMSNVGRKLNSAASYTKNSAINFSKSFKENVGLSKNTSKQPTSNVNNGEIEMTTFKSSKKTESDNLAGDGPRLEQIYKEPSSNFKYGNPMRSNSVNNPISQ